MQKISAVVITYNEEKNIARCINSLKKVADEIVVVDSFSTDKTEQISKELGARFITHHFSGYRNQKNFAIQQAEYNMILSLDADEAISVELEESILSIKKHMRFDAYKISRLNNFQGNWIYYTDWYPERYIRLFDKRKGLWQGDNIHEKVQMFHNSKVGTLKGDILHWRCSSIEEFYEEINHYSTLSANEYYKRGVKSNLFKVFFHSSWRFIHSFFLKGGFLAGFNGYTISLLLAQQCYLKYSKLRELNFQRNVDFFQYHDNLRLSKEGIRIGFDAKRVFFNNSGLGNYSRDLVGSISESYEKNAFVLFTPKTKKTLIPINSFNASIVSPGLFIRVFFNWLWRSLLIVNSIKRSKVNIYHGLSNELPFGIKRSGAKSVVTIHDLIFVRYPRYYKRVDRFIYKWKMKYSCNVADKIVSVSTQTKEDLVKFFNVNPSKIEVIPQGCNSRFMTVLSPDSFNYVKSKYSLPQDYILSVGTIEERKNLMSLIKTYKEKRIMTPLIVVGRKTKYYYSSILPYIKSNELTNIIFLENVSNDELPVIYKNAKGLIYISLFEGYGIPIIEGFASGIPVIASKGSCFEETGGTACIYVNPLDITEIGDAIMSVLFDDILTQNMIKEGYNHIKQLEPHVIASEYMNIYQTLLNKQTYENKWVFDGEKCHQALLPC